MDFLSSEYLSALLAIIVIDLVLAGDNAIVIGLAARRCNYSATCRRLFYFTSFICPLSVNTE
ncbi:hypothetical protein ABFV50_28925, partial [Bacillus cereus]